MKFLKDAQFVLLLRQRVEQAQREGRDVAGAALHAIREHHETAAPMPYQLLQEVSHVEVQRGAETVYRIHMTHALDEGIIEINQKEITEGARVFIEKYLSEFNEFLTFPKGAWPDFISGVLKHDRLTILEGREDMTEENIAIEAFIEKAQRWSVTRDMHRSLREDDYVWYEDDTGHVLVRSERVNRFLKGMGYKVPIERFGHLLRERGVAIQSSFQRKVLPKDESGKTQNLHFWRLNATVLGITAASIQAEPSTNLPPDVADGAAEGTG